MAYKSYDRCDKTSNVISNNINKIMTYLIYIIIIIIM